MKRTISFLAAILLPLSLFGQSYPIVPGGGGGGGSGTVTSVGATSSSAALGITGSPIAVSGTFAFSLDSDLTQFAALADPGAHHIMVWNDTANQYAFAVIGSGLSFDGTTMTATASGGAPSSATYITQTADASLSNEQAMGSLATGLVKNTTTTGVQSIAVVGTDYATAFSHLTGAATDAQIPNTITIDLATTATTATTANSGDSATGFFASGQIDRARGGTGADTSAYGDGILGSDASNVTVDVDNLTKLSSALGIGGTPSGTTYLRGDGQWGTPAGGGGGGDMLAANNLSDLLNPATARTNLGVAIVASGFDGNLTTSDDSIQEVAQKVDDLLPGGAAPPNATYITQTTNATLSNEQALASLATGLMKNTTTTGVVSIASPGTDYLAPTGDGSGLSGITFIQLSGSIADGQIPATIARDAEVSATYAPQATTLTMTGTSSEISVDTGAQNLSANRTWVFGLPNVVDLGSKSSLIVPKGSSPTPSVFGQIGADSDTFGASRGTIVTFDGTAITNLVGVLASDTPVAGHVPIYQSNGTVTWEPVTATASGSSNWVQYAGAGSTLSAEAGFEYDPATNILLVPGISTTNLNAAAFKVLDSVDQSHGILFSVPTNLTADRSFEVTGGFNFNMTLTADSSPTFPSGTTTLAHTTGPAGSMTVVASGFNGNLATSDDTVQEIAQKLDDLSVGAASGDPVLIGGTAVTDAAGVNFVVGTGLDLALTGSAPQVASFDIDTSEFNGARGWGSGVDASQVWTWDLSAGDPSITFGSGTVNISSGALQVGGITVPTISSTSTLTNKDLTDATNTLPGRIQVACSDMTTAIAAGTNKAYFRAPHAMSNVTVRASVFTAPTGANFICDINEAGTTIMSTNKLSIDATEKTSTTAATAAVVTDTSIADDAEVTIDFDQVGSTVAGAGVIVTIFYNY